MLFQYSDKASRELSREQKSPKSYDERKKKKYRTSNKLFKEEQAHKVHSKS